MSMTIGVEDRESVTVLALDGELDLATAGELSDALQAQHQRGRAAILLDLSSLSFCDSAGLRVFVKARRQAEEDGGSFAIASPTAIVRRVLEVSGLADVFGTYPTIDEGLAAVSAR
jgi:anti-anti-sigma factor